MTTLEVVEAVQRSLENEGFLQAIRAQLRLNVLRIISSGPDYVPSQGKVVEFSGKRSGTLCLHLVKDLLSTLGLKESLSVFEAESGIDDHPTIDPTIVEAELNIHRYQNMSLLECLVLEATSKERIYNGDQLSSNSVHHSSGDASKAEDDKKGVSYGADTSVNKSVDQSANHEEEEEEVDSVEEQIDKEEIDELEELQDEADDGDEDFSQLEDKEDVAAHQSKATSRVEVGYKFSSADSPVRSSYGQRTGMGGHLDESSSFEADSPAKAQMRADLKQTSSLKGGAGHYGAADVDDSFADDSVQEQEDRELGEASAASEEECRQQEAKPRKGQVPPVSSATTALSSQRQPAADVDDSFAEEESVVEEVDESVASDEHDEKQEEQGRQKERVTEEDSEGPEYDSDAARSNHSHHSHPEPSVDHKQEHKQEQKQGSPVSPARKTQVAEEKYSMSSSEVSADEKEEEVALNRATAEDFDRVDRVDLNPDMAARRANARNRVSVQRAGHAAEGKDSGDDSSRRDGAKASVFRLGQSSISRSTLGWGNISSNMDTSASFEEDGRSDDEAGTGAGAGRGFAPSTGGPEGRAGSRGGNARYSSSSQMEAVSFESTDNEPSPVMEGHQQQRRSNNQEESEEEAADAADLEEAETSEFEVYEEPDDEHSSPQQSPPRKNSARGHAAFGSPAVTGGKEQAAAGGASPAQENEEEKDEEGGEEDYADEDFDEDFEEDDAAHDSDESPAKAPPQAARLFSAPASSAPAAGRYNPTMQGGNQGQSQNQHDSDGEAEEVESVEEEIEEEEEQDEFSVGDQGSDEEDSDGGFGGKKPSASSHGAGQGHGQGQGLGMSRAGRSGVLPGVKAPAAAARGSHFDALLNNSDSEGDSPPPAKGRAVPGITARMHEIDSQLAEMERDDSAGNLAKLRKAHEQDDNSVASEDIDAMEFSTGGGASGDDSESSGEGSFSFLDSSSKK